MDRVRNFLVGARHAAGTDGDTALEARDLEGMDAELVTSVDRLGRDFHEALDDDFNSAGALGKVFELVRAGNAFLKEGGTSPRYRDVLREISRRIQEQLAFLGIGVEPQGESGESIPSEVLELVEKREDARRRKDWAAADELRDAIKNSGYVVEDRQEGPLVKGL